MCHLLTEGFECERFQMTELSQATTKSLYLSYTETMAPPNIELKYPERDWRKVWERLDSGSLHSA